MNGAGIKYFCGLILQGLLVSSFRWNNDVCAIMDAGGLCADGVVFAWSGNAVKGRKIG